MWRKYEHTFELADAYARTKESPDAFALPAEERARALRPGCLVKLVFLISYKDSNAKWATEGERMWVEVTENDYPSFAGILDNDAYCTNDIQSGIKVNFTAAHVIEIYGREAFITMPSMRQARVRSVTKCPLLVGITEKRRWSEFI